MLTDYTVEFLKKQRSKPFVMYLAHKAVHGPFTPAERHKDLFAERNHRPHGQRAGQSGRQAGHAAEIDEAPAVAKDAVGSSDDLIKNQLRCLTAIDEGVGRILKTLEETKQLDNTFIVFTSDNGYFWGEHHLGDKRWAYEESIRIPMLMRYPKRIKAGSKIRQMVMNVDMAPTMLELVGGTAPKEVQGRSIVPLLKGGKREGLADVVPVRVLRGAAAQNACRAGRRSATSSWKYIHYTDAAGHGRAVRSEEGSAAR